MTTTPNQIPTIQNLDLFRRQLNAILAGLSSTGGYLRPVTDFGPYGTSDDTATVQAAINSGEPFYLPFLGLDANNHSILSKIQQLTLRDKTVILGIGYRSGFQSLTGVNAPAIISDPNATGMMLDKLLVNGDWMNQADAATGVAHGINITGSYQVGYDYPTNPVRLASDMNDTDPRHTIDVRIVNCAGAGLYMEGLGGHEVRVQIMACCDGMVWQCPDSRVDFDIGGSARHGLTGLGYCGDNRFFGKSWFSGQGAGNSPDMVAKLTAAGIDTTAAYYDYYFVSAVRNQFNIQAQDGAASCAFFQYTYDTTIWGHLEGPADAVYGTGIGKPGSAALTIDSNYNFKFDGIMMGTQPTGEPTTSAPYMINFVNANPGYNIVVSQRGWTMPAGLGGLYQNQDGYLRVNGVVYSQKFGLSSDSNVFIGAASPAGLNTGMICWPGGDVFGNAGYLDVSCFKAVRFAYQDPVTTSFSLIGEISPTGLSMDGGVGIPIIDPTFVPEQNSALSTYGQMTLGLKIGGNNFGRVHFGSATSTPGRISDLFQDIHQFVYQNVSAGTFTVHMEIHPAGIQMAALASGPSYADDTAAAAGGVALTQLYRNGSQLMVRVI